MVCDKSITVCEEQRIYRLDRYSCLEQSIGKNVKNERQCTCNMTLRVFRVNIFAEERNNFPYSGYVSRDVIIQHAKGIDRVILPSVSSPAQLYFSALSNRLHDFCFDFF